MKIGLVGCGKAKMNKPAEARDLYRGPLFRLTRRYAEGFCDDWVILSAKYGVLNPRRVISPYDTSMKSLSLNQRREWAERASVTLRGRGEVTFIFLAGSDYEGAVEGIAGVERPLVGLGIGERMAWLKRKMCR